MTLKIFLPMGEKPPDIFGQGRYATPNRASLAISIPTVYQILQEFSVLRCATLRSTACPFIVVILYGTSLPPLAVDDRIVLVVSKQFSPAYWNHHTTETSTTTSTISKYGTCLSLPHTLFLASSLSSAISLLPMLLCTAATLLIVILLPNTGFPSPGVGNRTVLGMVMQCLLAHQNLNIATTTATTAHRNFRQVMAIGIYGTCPSQPADGHRLRLVPSRPLIPSYFARTRQYHTSKITPTTARLFIVILDSKTRLVPSIPEYLHHIADLPPDIQSILTQVGCIHVHRILHVNAYPLYLAILLAHKHAFLHVYFLHATIVIHDNTYQIYLTVLLLPPVAACADSYSAPSSISDGALAMLGKPSCTRQKQATTTTSHASLPMSFPTSSLILAPL